MAIFNGRGTVGIRSGVSAGPQLDADATAFILAANITNSTQQSAIYTLVTSLKSAGVWTKMKAIYPFVGGTPSSHKFNLKDPRNDNGAYRLTFAAGLTHSSNGINGNSTGYANTYFNPSNNMSLDNGHFSIYSRTSISSTVIYGGSGCYNGTSSCMYLSIKRQDGLTFGSLYSDTYSASAGTSIDGKGFFNINRQSNSLIKLLKNNSQIGINTNNQTGVTMPSLSLYLCGINYSGFADLFDNKEVAFATIGDGLTDTEASNLYTAVQTYQTSLSRNV